jgi:predicted HTH domain antitoxin
MHTLTIELPENVLLATGQSREDFVREARFLLAAKLFELGRLSSGKAAELCAMERVEFLFAAGRIGVPVSELDPSELEREFRDG